MSFIADKQTLEDLNITGKYRQNSVYSLFNQVHTYGGEKLLDSMFEKPLNDEREINRRSAIFESFQKMQLSFPFDAAQINHMENYLGVAAGESFIPGAMHVLKKKLLAVLTGDDEYQLLHAGLQHTMAVLNSCKKFTSSLIAMKFKSPYLEEIQRVMAVFNDNRLKTLLQEDTEKPISLLKVIKFDHLARNVLQTEMRLLIETICHIDVYMAVGKVAASKGFVYAQALPKEKHILEAAAVHHPCIEKAVANSIALGQDSNMIFLTGANMAGKSTFMKTLGISVYLAHMGFPVAAKAMTFSVMDGIYSSINVADDLNLGYSHFYAEVLRVKTVAQQVSSEKNLVVIFDELFKGTNVKDAYDATLAVTKALAGYRNCIFIISTHIIEAGKELAEQCSNIQFLYLPTMMNDKMPVYTYQLQEGISGDRHGMMIIENERILEILAYKKIEQQQ